MTQYFKTSDGEVHQFPDDATPAEIDAATRTMPRTAASDYPQRTVAPEAPRTIGQQTSDAVFGFGHNVAMTLPKMGLAVVQGANYVQNKINPFDGMRNTLNSATQTAQNVMGDEEANYQSGPNSTGANIGGALGNILPFAVGPGAKALDAIGTKASSMLPKTAGAFGRKAVYAGSSGAALGALTPTHGDNFATEKAGQILFGALASQAAPLAGAAYGGTKSFLARLAGTNGAADSQIANLLGNDPAVLAQLQQAGRGIPGLTPTVAEAVTNPKTVATDRILRNRQTPDSTPFTNADIANNEARVNVVKGVAGTDAELQAAKDARELATQPFIDKHLVPALPGDRFSEAFKAITTYLASKPKIGGAAMDALRQAKTVVQKVIRGDMQEDDAVAELKDLHASVPETTTGQPSKAMQVFDEAHTAIDHNQVDPSPVLDAISRTLNTGMGTNPTVKKALQSIASGIQSSLSARGKVSADVLDGYRRNASKILADNHNALSVVGSQEEAGLAPITAKIKDTLDAAVPGYRAYLAAHAQLSEPINTMQAGRKLLAGVLGTGDNAGGDQVVTLNALRVALNKDNLARYPMSDAARAKLTAVFNSLQDRSGSNNITGASGPGTAADITGTVNKNGLRAAIYSGGLTLGSVLGMAAHGPEGAVAGPALTALMGLAEHGSGRLSQRVSQRMASASMAAQILQRQAAQQQIPKGFARLFPGYGQLPKGFARLPKP